MVKKKIKNKRKELSRKLNQKKIIFFFFLRGNKRTSNKIEINFGFKTFNHKF